MSSQQTYLEEYSSHGFCLTRLEQQYGNKSFKDSIYHRCGHRGRQYAKSHIH